MDYLRKQMPFEELNAENSACYALAVDMDSADGRADYQLVMSSRPAYTRLFGSAQELSFESEAVFDNTYAVQRKEEMRGKIYGSVHFLELYNTNTPFEQEAWELIALDEADNLHSFSKKVTTDILLVLTVSILLGVVFISIVDYRLTRPIVELSRQVQKSDPRQPVLLPRLDIKEIDQLSEAIEKSSQSVADEASKLVKILDMVNVSLGAFEYQQERGLVYCTKGCVRLMDLLVEEEEQDGIFCVPLSVFDSILHPLLEKGRAENGEETMILSLTDSEGIPRSVRLKMVENNGSLLGVLMDITQELAEKRRLEYERDYDLLTTLLNRRAFYDRVKRLFEHPQQMGIAALIMIDLDNLKYINDTYGHDCGDEYIRAAASVLRGVSSSQIITARMSGDEFFIFSKDTLPRQS